MKSAIKYLPVRPEVPTHLKISAALDERDRRRRMIRINIAVDIGLIVATVCVVIVLIHCLVRLSK